MSQHRKVFVFKDVNYGASKSSATQNTATNPADLAEGAVGIYGIHRAGSTNNGKLALITDGGSEAAGLVPMATFVGDEILIALGTSNGVLISNPVQNVTGRHRFTGKAYTAPVKGISTVGYTSGGGLLNYPSTILKGDLLQVTANNKRALTSGERQPFVTEAYSVELLAGDTVYVALVKLVTKMIAMDPTQDRTLVDVPRIVTNATGAVFANTATVAAVNGAVSLTTSAAHGVTAGDAVRLAGDYYLTVAGTTGSTLVLDRPYTGATGTIANADTLDITGAATQYGLEFVDSNFQQNTEITVTGVLQNSTVTRTTLPLQGSGSSDLVLKEEKEYRQMLGTADFIHEYIPKEPFKTVNGTTYDMYIVEANNASTPRGEQGSVFKVVQHTMLFFPVAADTTNKGQSDFEDIMQQLFGASSFPSIS